MVNVFNYQNYREYLREFYNEQKVLKKNFSYRAFSKMAGIATSSFFFHVIEGKRNLTKATVLKISSAIGHDREDADFFENLVFFNQAKSIAEKTLYYSRLIENRKTLNFEEIPKDRFEFYRTWYHSVVREVITLFDFQDDFEKLGSFIVPPIRAIEAKKSVALLEKLGFIEKGKDGKYHQTTTLINVKVSAREAFIIEKFQMEMLEVALRAYNCIPVHNRMSLSTTITVSEETFELFKLRLREMQRQLMEISNLDSKPTAVYQLTVNLFPISKSTAIEATEK
jgi:uncharacterized protein (TIGR02147 family)